MPHRDDLEAAHARIAALERELKAASDEKRARVRCARCHSAFEPDDLDRASGQLTCRRCRYALKPGRSRPAARSKVPRGLEVDDGPERLRIAWRWRVSPIPVAGLFGVLALLVAAAIADTRSAAVLVFAVIVLGVAGLGFAYRVAGQLANRTVILVSRERIRIENGPVAIQRVRTFAADEIDQLYCVLGRTEHFTWYDVYAQLADGNRVCLVGDVANPARAFFLEREMERRLGVVDRPVRGEVARREG